MKKASIIMAVLACAIIAAAYTNSVPISVNTRAATEKWTAIRFEPALPPTPENAESKFLNGNREWQTVAEQDLAALRAYHYGSPDIVESPAEWFTFDGAGTITAFNWQAGRENVVIPWEIGGVPVTAIGDNAFVLSGVVSVIAPQTVTTVYNNAFAYCGALTSLNIPQVTSIGDNAFYSCFALTLINLPQATAIGSEAFYYCLALTAVHMGQNAPAEATDVFANITPPPNIHVTDPQATGWGATWNGAPVVRPPLYGSNVTAQAITLGGDTITEWPAGGGETGIIAPLYESGTNVTVTSTQSVYSVAVTGAGPVGIDWSGLALDGTGRAEVTLRLNVADWAGTNVTFAPSLTFDATPEILVTGVWEFAASTIDGVTTRVRQTWPEIVECNVLVPQVAFGGSASLGYGGNRLQTLGTAQDGLIQYYWPLCAADVVMVRIDAAAAQTSGFPLGSFCDYRVEGYNVSISPIVTNRCEVTESSGNVGGPVTIFRGTAEISGFSVSSMLRLRRLILSGDPSSTNAHVWVNAAYRELNANERAAYAAGWRP